MTEHLQESKFDPQRYTAAPSFYTNPEWERANFDYQKIARTTPAKGAKYTAALKEAETRRNNAPRPKLSAAYGCALIIVSWEKIISKYAEKKEKAVKRIYENAIEGLTWAMDELIHAQVMIEIYSRLLARISILSAENALDARSILALWDEKVQYLKSEIMGHARQLSSRSSSASSNVVEDMIIEQKADIVSGLGLVDVDYVRYYIDNDLIVWDENKFPVKYAPED
jgi:hypothetical protein